MKLNYFLIALCYSLQVFSQDLRFINAPQSLVYLNPSFAGSNGKLRFQNNYQSDYRKSNLTSAAYQIGVDGYIKALHGGLALTLTSDDVNRGTLKTTFASLAYAQYLSFKKGKYKLIPSIEVSFIQKKLDVNSLSFGDFIDPRYGRLWTSNSSNPTSQKNNLDVNAGLLFQTRTAFLGVSAKHINSPDVGLSGTYKLPTQITAYLSQYIVSTPWYDSSINIRYIRQMGKNYMQEAINLITMRNIIYGFGIINGYSTPFINIGYKGQYFAAQLLFQGNPYVLKSAFKSNRLIEASLSLNFKDPSEQAFHAFEKW